MAGGGGPSAAPNRSRPVWRADPALPVEGSVELNISLAEFWQTFEDVARWPLWNKCFWRARVSRGALRRGRLLVWAFNPIRRRYLYKLPAVARLVEVIPRERVTWEVRALPGFYARHTYWMESAGDGRCRFGSWEVAQGPVYTMLRPFWLAHFRYVRDESLVGARRLLNDELV